MNNNKVIFERISGISAFVVGCLICFIYVIGLLVANGNPAIIVNALIFLLFNGFLILFGLQIGIKNDGKPHFSKVFNIVVLSLLGCMLYSATLLFFSFIYLIPTVTGVISIFQNSNYQVEETKVIDNENNVIKEEKIENNRKLEFEEKIILLKSYKEKNLISEEQYKEEINKLMKEL